MNIFRTEILPAPSDGKISLSSPLLTIGSCFSDSIGNKLNESKFNVLSNPFGTVYNPLSIHGLLEKAIEKILPEKASFLERDGMFLNYHFHSKFISTTEPDLARQIKESIDTSHAIVNKAKVLIITYGTSYVFERTDTKEVVANCHKMPTSHFHKKILSVEEIVSSFHQLHEIIIKQLAVEKIILTVSPVRHIKDTLQLNSLSKSILRIACQQLVNQYPGVEYFPAYEIMMDDLRDYRFYKNDMIHPNETAEDYIWEKFSDIYFDGPTIKFLNRWNEIRKALAHRPFQSGSPAHKKFLTETLAQLEALKSVVNVEDEINQIRIRLASST